MGISYDKDKNELAVISSDNNMLVFIPLWPPSPFEMANLPVRLLEATCTGLTVPKVLGMYT